MAYSLYRQRLYLFYPTNMPMEPSISLNRLAALPLILASRPSVVRASLDRAFADAKLRPNLVAEVDNFMAILSMVGWHGNDCRSKRGSCGIRRRTVRAGAHRVSIFLTASLAGSIDVHLPPAAEEVRKLFRNLIERHVRESKALGIEWLA
jgi:hypothetical protein